MATPDTSLGFLEDFWQAGSKALGHSQLGQAGTDAMNFVEALGAPTSGRSQVAMGTSAAKLGSTTGVLPKGFGAFAGDVTALTNIITGVQRGGVSGYSQAGVNTAQLAGNLLQQGAKAGYLSSGTGAMGAEIGAAAAPLASALSVYNFAKGWQSGATGADALRGAQMGATIGTEILPGVGTVLGGLAGAAFGAVSSAFGGGMSSQEGLTDRGIDASLAAATDPQRAAAINQMNPSNAFQMIQGYMNAHDNSPGHSEKIEQVFGKNGVSSMMGQMLPAINAAIQKNPALGQLSAQQLYQQVAVPWLKSRGATIDPNTRDVRGNPEGQNLIDAVTSFIGDWQSGQATSSTRLGVGGETLNIPAYAGTAPQAQAATPNAQQTAQQATQSAFNSLGVILPTGGTW